MEKLTASQQKRYTKVVLTLATVRQDIRAYNLTGELPEYAQDIYELKDLEAYYSSRAYTLRNGERA